MSDRRFPRQVMVRLSEDDYGWLVAEAEREERQMAQVVRRLIHREQDRQRHEREALGRD